MKYLDENFLLSTPQAVRLYKEHAQNRPIFDFHCHISPEQLAENRPFADITQLWLGGDHYKWRAMRAMGYDEKFITGDADSFEKFAAWADTVEHCLGNPLYNWTHLELRRYFGIEQCLCSANAREIYDRCNALLATPELLPQNIVLRSGVSALCTTDDPADDLRHHIRLREEGFACQVLPTFRPDKAVGINKPGFIEYIARLEVCAGKRIESFAGLCEVLSERLDFFVKNGCRATDISLEIEEFTIVSEETADLALRAALAGKPVTARAAGAYQSLLLLFLAQQYKKHGLVMQLHIGALRNVSDAMFERLGPDAGFDDVNDASYIRLLAAYLNAVQKTTGLPNTVLYNLNDKDSQALCALAASFCGSGANVQYGAAWWFLDTLSGNRKQLQTVAELHLLPKFIGMLTDSRSLLSYTRHEYFRRILCGMLGEWMRDGLIPDDLALAGRTVSDISYENAARFFGIA